MILILLILIFLTLHILFYRILKINIINFYIITIFNISIISIIYYLDINTEFDLTFLILLVFNSFVFCYAIFFTGVIDDSPSLKIIYYIHYNKLGDKNKLKAKFIKSGSIKLRYRDLFDNRIIFSKKKNIYNLTKFSKIIIFFIILIEKSLKLKSDA